MIGQAALREVVGANAVAAVARANQALAQGGFFGFALFALFLLNTRLQHLQGLGLVAVLAAAVLALGHDARGQVHHAHGGVGLVDVLATGTAGAEGVDAQIGRVEGDGRRFIGLGHHGHGAGAGVNAALCFGGGHALHAVAARFELERAVDVVALNAQHHFFVAANFAFVGGHDFHLPAHVGGIAGVHAGHIAGKQGGLISAGTRADFHIRRAFVVRVFGQQQALQLVFQLEQRRFAFGNFLLRHLGHVGVFQHLAGRGDIGLGLQVALVAARHRSYIGVFARDAAVLVHIAHDVFAREQKVQFFKALGIALQLGAQEWLHGGVQKKEGAT